MRSLIIAGKVVKSIFVIRFMSGLSRQEGTS